MISTVKLNDYKKKDIFGKIQNILNNELKEIDYTVLNETIQGDFMYEFTKLALPSFVHHPDVREIRLIMHATFLAQYRSVDHDDLQKYVEQIPGSLLCGELVLMPENKWNNKIFKINDDNNIGNEEFIYALYVVTGTCTIIEQQENEDEIPAGIDENNTIQEGTFYIVNFSNGDKRAGTRTAVERIIINDKSIVMEFWWKITTMKNNSNNIPKPWIRRNKTITLLRNEHLEYFPSLRTILNEQDLFPEVCDYPKYPEIILKSIKFENLHIILKYVPQTRLVYQESPVCHHAYALYPRRFFHFGLNKKDRGSKYNNKYSQAYTKKDLSILIPQIVHINK